MKWRLIVALSKDMLTNSQDVMIVNTSIQLIHGLGFTVGAEGVEEPEGVFELLRNPNCDIIRYVFSKPLKRLNLICGSEAFNWEETRSKGLIIQGLT